MLDSFRHCITNLIPHYQNYFSQTFLFVFNSKLKKCLEICENCVWNCLMPLFSPLEVKFWKIFFQKCAPPSTEMRNLFQRWHVKDIKDKNQGFKKLGALQITILLMWWLFKKIALGNSPWSFAFPEGHLTFLRGAATRKSLMNQGNLRGQIFQITTKDFPLFIRLLD